MRNALSLNDKEQKGPNKMKNIKITDEKQMLSMIYSGLHSGIVEITADQTTSCNFSHLSICQIGEFQFEFLEPGYENLTPEEIFEKFTKQELSEMIYHSLFDPKSIPNFKDTEYCIDILESFSYPQRTNFKELIKECFDERLEKIMDDLEFQMDLPLDNTKKELQDLVNDLIRELSWSSPLKWRDIYGDQWVWDNISKEYIYIYKPLDWEPVKGLRYAHHRINNSVDGYYMDFEENRFYSQDPKHQ